MVLLLYLKGQEELFMRYLITAALLCSALAVADTIGEQARFIINPINATDFEVIEGHGMGAAEFWCAVASLNAHRQGRSESILI